MTPLIYCIFEMIEAENEETCCLKQQV